MKTAQPLITIALALFVLGALGAQTATNVSPNTKPDELQKSKNKYRQVSFSNGLKKLLLKNASIFKSKASLLSFEALKEEAYGSAYPTFSFLTFAAPIFEARGNALGVTRNYKKWGPVVFTQAQMTLPIFTWGAITKAKKAADAGIIAGNQLHQSEINKTIFEYKKLYLQMILLKRFRIILDDASEKIGDALEKAQESYNTGEGKVKKKDIVRLKLFSLEHKNLLEEWKANKEKAALGLGHFLGERTPLDVADTDFPEVDLEAPALNKLVQLGFKDNPDWRALKAGLRARKLQVEFNKAQNLPVFFLAAQGNLAFSNVRERQDSPFANDPFNRRDGAIVAGARWTLDWGPSKARVTRARAEYETLLGQKKEALSGIPFLISSAYLDLQKSYNQWRIAQRKYKEASKWSLAEWTSYSAGVGDAKDLLESLAAFFEGRQQMAEAEYRYVLAWAKLSLEVGRKGMLTKWKPRED